MRKKILQISPYTFDHPGGVEQYAKTLQEIFPEDIYTLSGGGEFAIVEPVLHCPLPCFWRKGFWKNLNKISKENTKYIISHIRFAPTSWFAFFLAKTRGIPYIHIEHGTGFLVHKNIAIAGVAKLVDLIIGRYIIQHATHVICVSEAGKKWVSKTFGRNDIEVIYRGFTFPTVERKKNKIPKIGFVGRLTGLKNIAGLIESLSELQGERWILEIVGDGEERKNLERLSQERGIEDRITFLGAKSHEWIINEFYPTVDIFINPSLQEGLPTTVIEALGMGCTVIATDVGGTREIEGVILIKEIINMKAYLFDALKESSHQDKGGIVNIKFLNKNMKSGYLHILKTIKRQKIVVFNLNGRGGMLHYSSQFSNALNKVHDIRVIVPSYANIELYNKDIILWKIRTNPTLISFLLDSINIFAHIHLLSLIWKFRPEVIQIMDNHPWYFFYTFVGKLLGAKIYVIQHDPFPHSGERNGLFHQIAICVNIFLRRISDRLIVHGEKMKEKIIKEYKIPKDKTISIYHGSYDLFPNRVKNNIKDGNTFLFFGRIAEYKGLDILLAALKLLDNESMNYHVIIAGDGDISSYQKAIGEIKKTNLTLENRFIEDREIARFFEQSSFVVLPYKDATASGIIPLSYSFGLPVIATEVGVLTDYIIHNETGLLIPPNNPETLKEAIVELLRKKDKTKALSRNAFEFQKKYLSWNAIIHTIYHD